VADWLGGNFRCEREGGPGQELDRLKISQAVSPEEIFRRRTGMPLDAAVFTKRSLNRINPAYRAEVIHVRTHDSFSHYVCGFQLGGRLFVMDYANPTRREWGLTPFRDLGEYVERLYSRKNGVRATAHPDPARPSADVRKQKPGGFLNPASVPGATAP